MDFPLHTEKESTIESEKPIEVPKPIEVEQRLEVPSQKKEEVPTIAPTSQPLTNLVDKSQEFIQTTHLDTNDPLTREADDEEEKAIKLIETAHNAKP